MAATWSVIGGYQRSVQSVQALSEAAPTLPIDGVLLTGVDSVVPILTAPNGQTFTGAGTIQAWYYSETLARWIRAPRGDDALADLAGLAEGALPAIPVTSRHGRFAWIAVGVGVSGGTQIQMTLECSAIAGGGAL